MSEDKPKPGSVTRRDITIIDGPRSMGDGAVCVIRGPAGAVAALYAPAPSPD